MDFESYYEGVSKNRPVSRKDAYERWLTIELARVKGKPKPAATKPTKKKKKRTRKVYDRKNWTPNDPCMKCGHAGPHLVEYSHLYQSIRQFKASCLKCGAYQKFLSELQAAPFVTGEPVWRVAESINAPY